MGEPTTDERHEQPQSPASGTDTAARWRIGRFVYDAASMQLLANERPTSVEPRPLRLLEVLLEHAGEVVTKEELMTRVWEGRPTVDNVIANAVAKLRRALGDDDGSLIVNVPRVGYRLVGATRLAEAHAVSARPRRTCPRWYGQALVRNAAIAACGAAAGWLAHHLMR